MTFFYIYTIYTICFYCTLKNSRKMRQTTTLKNHPDDSMLSVLAGVVCNSRIRVRRNDKRMKAEGGHDVIGGQKSPPSSTALK